MQYSFFLFSMLVNDDLIKRNNLSVPYDILHTILIEHYLIFKVIDANFDISEYEAMELYITCTGSLLADLMAMHIEYTGPIKTH